MKKLTGKILAIAAAFAFASVFASCSFLDESDDSILSYLDPSALSAVNNGGSGNSGSSSGSGGSGSTGSGSTVTVNATWDASAGVKYSTGTLTGTGATWTWATSGATLADKDGYIVQVSKGSSNKAVATLAVEGSCTVTVTFRYGGDYDAAKIRDLDVGGSNKPMESTTDKAVDYTVVYTATSAGNIAIAGNGVNIKKIEVN